MQISFAAPAAVRAGSWVVGVPEGGALNGAAAQADKAAGGALSRALKLSRFTGKSGQMVELLAPAGLAASRLILVGLGKPADLDVINPEGEMDRTLMERIVAPLEHMLRNSVDHGIEDPAGRAASGKPAQGRVTLTLAREGGEVVLTLPPPQDGNARPARRVRPGTAHAENGVGCRGYAGIDDDPAGRPVRRPRVGGRPVRAPAG